MGGAGARNRFLLHLIHESCQVARLGWKNMEGNGGTKKVTKKQIIAPKVLTFGTT